MQLNDLTTESCVHQRKFIVLNAVVMLASGLIVRKL